MIFLNRSTKTRFIYVPRNPANKEMSCILVDVFVIIVGIIKNQANFKCQPVVGCGLRILKQLISTDFYNTSK